MCDGSKLRKVVPRWELIFRCRWLHLRAHHRDREISNVVGCDTRAVHLLIRQHLDHLSERQGVKETHQCYSPPQV